MASHGDFYSSPQPVAHSFTHPPSLAVGTTPPPPPKSIPQLPTYGQSYSGPPSTEGPPPPPLPQDVQTTGSSRPPLPMSDGLSLQQRIQPHERPSPIPPPNFEDHWLPGDPDLTLLSTTDLQPLLQNSNLLTSLAQQHLSYQSSVVSLRTQLQQNIQLASKLRELEVQINTLRHTTSQLLLQHTSLQNTWRRKQSEMDDALSPWGPRAMYQRLIASINEQEAVARAVLESFLEGGGSGAAVGEDAFYGAESFHSKASEKAVSDWIRQIREGTTVLERRKEMRARWDEGRVGGWR